MSDLYSYSHAAVGFLLSWLKSNATLVLTFVTVWLTLIILRYTAKPRIAIRRQGRRRFSAGEITCVSFLLENKGHLYAGCPPATGIVAYINCHPALAPQKIRYGSDLTKENSQARFGKGGSRYLKAEGIKLFHEEPGEEIELTVRMPDTPGKYFIRISLHSAEGGYAVRRIPVIVKRARATSALERNGGDQGGRAGGQAP